MAKLYFYYSSMNAGKTTVLLQTAHNYRERGMTPLLFTPVLDDRYSTGVIKSRIGLEAEAISFEREDDLFRQVQQRLEGVVRCFNPNCITNAEPVTTCFEVVATSPPALRCIFC